MASRIGTPFAADGLAPCHVRGEATVGTAHSAPIPAVAPPSSLTVRAPLGARLARLVTAPVRAWRRVREAPRGRFLPRRLAGALGLRSFSGTDDTRRGLLRLCALAPVGLPVLAQAARGPAAGQLWTPQATPYLVGSFDVQAEKTVVAFRTFILGRHPHLMRRHPRLFARDLDGLHAEALQLTRAQAAARARIVDLLTAAGPFPGPACPLHRFPAPTLARQGAVGAIPSGGLS